MSEDRIWCDVCGRDADKVSSYVVRIDVFAEPSVPPLSTSDSAAANFDKTLDDLIEQMQQMTAQDLQDAVHRHFEYRLCATCHGKFLANPLGKPRSSKAGKN